MPDPMKPADEPKGARLACGCLLMPLSMLAFYTGIPFALWGAKGFVDGTMDPVHGATAAVSGVALAWAVPRLFMAVMGGRARLTARRMLTAFPDFAIAALYALAWAWPLQLPETMLVALFAATFAEFVVIHASLGLNVPLARRDANPSAMRWFWGLAAAYMVVAAGMALGIGSWWPLAVVIVLVANRIKGAFVAGDKGPDTAYLQRWAFAAVVYLFLMFAVMLAPGVPPLGMMRATGDGIVNREAFRVMAFGLLYFASLGAFELYRDDPVPEKGRETS